MAEVVSNAGTTRHDRVARKHEAYIWLGTGCTWLSLATPPLDRAHAHTSVARLPSRQPVSRLLQDSVCSTARNAFNDLMINDLMRSMRRARLMKGAHGLSTATDASFSDASHT